jgi:hypothetical protein
VDARPHFRWNVDEFKVRLAVTARLCALNEDAQDRKVDSIPFATVHDKVAAATGQGRDNLGAQTTAIRPVEILRESNPIS